MTGSASKRLIINTFLFSVAREAKKECSHLLKNNKMCVLGQSAQVHEKYTKQCAGVKLMFHRPTHTYPYVDVKFKYIKQYSVGQYSMYLRKTQTILRGQQFLDFIQLKCGKQYSAHTFSHFLQQRLVIIAITQLHIQQRGFLYTLAILSVDQGSVTVAIVPIKMQKIKLLNPSHGVPLR